MENNSQKNDVIQKQLNKYKEAVVGKKTGDELKNQRDSFLKKLAKTSGYSDLMMEDFLTQAGEIEIKFSPLKNN